MSDIAELPPGGPDAGVDGGPAARLDGLGAPPPGGGGVISALVQLQGAVGLLTARVARVEERLERRGRPRH